MKILSQSLALESSVYFEWYGVEIQGTFIQISSHGNQLQKKSFPPTWTHSFNGFSSSVSC